MVSAGTSKTNAQTVLSLIHIVRNELDDHIFDLIQEMLCDVMFEHKLADLFIVPSQVLQGLHVERIRYESGIKNHIR